MKSMMTMSAAHVEVERVSRAVAIGRCVMAHLVVSRHVHVENLDALDAVELDEFEAYLYRRGVMRVGPLGIASIYTMRPE